MPFDGKAFGEDVVAAVKRYVASAQAPLLARLEAVEKRLDETQIADADTGREAAIQAALKEALKR